MAWESSKQALLVDVERLIESRADEHHRLSLHNLTGDFYRRFPAEDLRGRSAENLYGCVYGILRFLQEWPERKPRVVIFNPGFQSHGWESKYTVVMLHCRAVPFCTASVRGELNRRQINIHSLTSCNVDCVRDEAGRLLEILGGDEFDQELPRESVLYFEISRHSRLEQLAELQSTLLEILDEVALVVKDFPAMRQRVAEALAGVENTTAADPLLRTEAAEFLAWLDRDHMTFLGYEHLRVERDGGRLNVCSEPDRSLGLLRNRTTTSGEPDLLIDLEQPDFDPSREILLSFSKSRRRSRVHRQTYPDYVEVFEFDDQGEVTGQHRFLGLYTFSVYTMDPKQIPVLRRRVERVVENSGLESGSHSARELVRTLELFPRDELFQSSAQQLTETARAVNSIQERRQTRLFVRTDPHGKFVNCLVYIPRDRYTTDQRMVIQDILTEAFHAEESEFTTQFSESILVRCYFVLRVDPDAPVQYDIDELEEQIVQATLAWEDRLHDRLIEEFGEELGEQYSRELAAGFPPGYRDDFGPRVAVADILKIQKLMNGQELSMGLYREVEDDELLRLRTYHREESLALSDVLPILENLGLRVVSERPYRVRAIGGDEYWVQEFSLLYTLADDIDLDEVRDEFEDAFARIWFGEAESDSFNRLLIGTRLNWREIALLRAYARYLRQLHFPYSVEYIAETMANQLHITAGIVELFLTRFSPVFEGDDQWREQREEALEQRILDALESVPNLGEDRIIRQFVKVVKATLRTNFFQQDAAGNLKPYFSFKLCPADIPAVPKPVPLYEIYVYSPRFEGVHLRGGKVARGGLRWSDRLEDFRTEILGLVKAQQVKNAVIVPVGAKGGFVARQLTSDMTREQVQREGIECYRTFIRGLLDITDNRNSGGVERPHYVVAKDDEDPYLVVAADKGTASFSDIANEIAEEYDFWLGNAFASGGSVGYDHKEIGITARGAWVSVQRHFREMGHDVQGEDFSVVGIGDMSGDVFGNGMLLSEHICLVAAFNHQHIFVDPEPDATRSFAERRRLFGLPRSTWGDYSVELISAGGGVFERSAKSIAISPQMSERFDIPAQSLTPNELISYLLRARVDLLWNGGIGTYVKSSQESHTDVGDKTNDGVRVDARELRCRVIGEGGNLGLTQRARIEYSLGGGRCNTDFIDNVGGVDCSDHEVNIKILLDAVVARGDLTVKQRNQLLEEMTDSVADLVLKNNYRQVQAISLAEHQALQRSGEYRRFISHLVEEGRLNRELEFIPPDEELADRRVQGKGLTRPELSVLVSYSKGILKEMLIDSDLGLDPHLAGAVYTAFPQRLADEYHADVAQHRLHREIMSTQIANDLINRMGLNFVSRQCEATGAPVADVARAYTTVLKVFSIDSLWARIEALDHRVEASTQMEMMQNLIQLAKRAVRWLLRNRRHELMPSDNIAEFGEGWATLRQAMDQVLRGRAAEQLQSQLDSYVEAGVDPALARDVAVARQAHSGLGIVQTAEETGEPLLQVAQMYYLIGEQLELDWFTAQILASQVENEWQAMARDAYLEDLDWQQRTLTAGALRHKQPDCGIEQCLQRWEEQETSLLARWRLMLSRLHAVQVPDFSMFAVANRELLDLAQSSLRK